MQVPSVYRSTISHKVKRAFDKFLKAFHNRFSSHLLSLPFFFKADQRHFSIGYACSIVIFPHSCNAIFEEAT